jgi:hypothetical protein
MFTALQKTCLLCCIRHVLLLQNVLNSPFFAKDILFKKLLVSGGIRFARNYVQLRENLIHRVRDMLIYHAGDMLIIMF